MPDTVPEEWSEELEPDPLPDGTPAPKPRPEAKPVTATMKKRIAAEIEMYVEFAAMPLLLRDPVCGGALHEQAEPIAAAIAQILTRYPDLAAKFLATGSVGDWIKLAVALQPVGKTIWEHHVTRPEPQEEDRVDLDDFDPYRPGR